MNGLDLSPYVVKDPGGSGGGGGSGGRREAEAASVAPPNGTAGVGFGGPPNDKGVVGVAVDASAGAGGGGVKGSSAAAVPPVGLDPTAYRGHGSDAPASSLLPNGGGGGGGVSGRTLPNGLPVPGAPPDTAGSGVEETEDREGEPLLTPGTGAVEADAGGGAGGESDGGGGGGGGGAGMAGAGVIGADVRELPHVFNGKLILSATRAVLCVCVCWPISHPLIPPFGIYRTWLWLFPLTFFGLSRCSGVAVRFFRLPPFLPAAWLSPCSLSSGPRCPRLVASPSQKGGRGGSLYDLYAVVHHLGALSSGHYVASVKSQPSGKWHYFNDDQVSTAVVLNWRVDAVVRFLLVLVPVAVAAVLAST